MKKTVKGKIYDTIEMSIVKKVTSGAYGDPAGYEETLYVAEDGPLHQRRRGVQIHRGEAHPDEQSQGRGVEEGERLIAQSAHPTRRRNAQRSVFSCRYRQKYRNVCAQNVIYFAVVGKKMRMTA